jgi:hypothetical protein
MTRHHSRVQVRKMETPGSSGRLSLHVTLLGAMAVALTIAATPLVDAHQGTPVTEVVKGAPLGALSPLIQATIEPLVTSAESSQPARSAVVLPMGFTPSSTVQERLVGQAAQQRWTAVEVISTGTTSLPPETAAEPSEPVALAQPAVEPLTPPVLDIERTPVQPGQQLWSGTIQSDGANLREQPAIGAASLAELAGGTRVRVVRWVEGEELIHENPVWAELESCGYVYSTTLRRDPLVETQTPAAAPMTDGRWLDVDLVAQTLTAYEGATPVRSALISSGRPGWDTPEGDYTILRRVEKETMDASTLVGAVPDGQATPMYKIEDVRHTQYFSQDGAAFHENFWRQQDLFGMPGSHGCVSLAPDDAAWLWEWADVGTPIHIHS